MDETYEIGKGIRSGVPIMLILHSPREKCWGILDEITAAGVFLRGLDLNSFDSWVQAAAHAEPFVGIGDLFFPMWRVERISRDEPVGDLPSLYQQVEQRTGRTVQDLMRKDRGKLN